MSVHRNRDAAIESLWGIINPEIKDSVPKDEIKAVLENLAAYAVDVPAYFQQFQEIKDTELDKYFEALKSKKSEVIENICSRLPGDVTKNEFRSIIVSIGY